MKKKLVFLLSSNYSGSHFCSLLIGSHSKGVHLGELKNIQKKSTARSCHICGDYGECRLFRDIDAGPLENVYEELFSRVDPATEFFIDASKKPKWFKHFVNDDRYEIKLLYLIRDPRALARRWLMRIDELNRQPRERIKQCRNHPHKAFLFLFGNLLSVCIYKWYTQNREIVDFIKQSNLPWKLITYRELAREQARTLIDICEWIGVDYEPDQQKYWEFDHHGKQKSEYEWVRDQGGAKYFDLRWKEFLDEKQQKQIMENKEINGLLSQLSLKFSDDGLVRA
jgi:hypothetical protein